MSMSTKALCHYQIVESPNISFPNPSFNNTVISLGIFFRHSQNLIAQCCSIGISMFPNIQRHTIWQYTSVLPGTLAFFSFSVSAALHICSYILMCLISRVNCFSLSPCAQSFTIGVCQHAFR